MGLMEVMATTRTLNTMAGRTHSSRSTSYFGAFFISSYDGVDYGLPRTSIDRDIAF